MSLKEGNTDIRQEPSASRKVLVVDDEILVRTVLRDRLEEDGFVVYEATNGEYALDRLVAGEHVDIMLLDMDMPVLGGLEVLARMKDEVDNPPPVLILSGNEDIAVVLEALILGAEQFIRKDGNLDKVVVPAIERCLEKQRLINENQTLVLDLKRKNDDLAAIVDTMTEIGIALSAETDLKVLLEIILTHARSYTLADAGTLYLREGDDLHFKVVQNETLAIQMGGASGGTVPFKPVRVDPRNVSGYVALHGETVNISNVYDTDLFDFTGPRKFDAASGYQSQSMLVVPLKDHHGHVVGVLQLLNSRSESDGHWQDFSLRHAQLAEALASQAAVAVTNLKLQQETVALKNYNEAVLESLTNGVLTLDEAGCVRTWNAAALRIMGRDAPEIGQDVQDFLGEGNRWIIDTAKQVRREGRPSWAVDVELELPDGGCVPVNAAIAPLEEGGRITGSILVCEDITKEKRIRSTLARYMPPHIAERLLEDDAAILGGTLQFCTVLFSDIRGFTSLAEGLGPRGAVDLLNDYFGRMAEVIFSRKGTVDKYIGDALLAVFGVPFVADDDADRAVLAALDMMKALRTMNEERAARWEVPLRVGIGLHSDEVVAGNIGSQRRMDFTIVGDGVNLASRLEGANKFYGTSVLLSQKTKDGLNCSVSCRPVDCLRVMGKQEAVCVWELLEARLDLKEAEVLSAGSDRFVEAVRLYRSREWVDAQKVFRELALKCPGDALSTIYVERCEKLIENSPGEEWDWVWSLDHK